MFVCRANSKPIHCNILMMGPLGVGMGTVVKAIVRGLNMHAVEVRGNSFLIVTPTELVCN